MWKPTPKKVASLIANGYGSGIGEQYQAWLRLKRGYFIPKSTHGLYICPWTGRQHHIFSQIEREVMIVARFVGAIDVWEQKPTWPVAHPHPLVGSPFLSCDIELPSSSGTLAIAEEMGIRHPRYPNSAAYWITTTDIMAIAIDKRGQPIVVGIHAKPSTIVRTGDFDQRPAELAEIERRGLGEMAIRFLVWDEKCCPKTLSDNLRRYYRCACLPTIYTEGGRADKFVQFASRHLEDTPIGDLLSVWAQKTSTSTEEAYLLFKYAAFSQRLPIDLSKPILHSRPAPIWDGRVVKQLRTIVLGEA